MATWTIAQIKRDLPDVPVKLPDGSTQTGRLAGRKCPFPQVTVTWHGIPLHLEVAWPTVERILNSGGELRV